MRGQLRCQRKAKLSDVFTKGTLSQKVFKVERNNMEKQEARNKKWRNCMQI